MLFKHFHTSLSRFWVRLWNLHLSLLNFLLYLAYHFGLPESSWIFLILANDPIMLFYVTSSLISHHFHPHTLYSIHTIRNIILGTSHALSRFESLHILCFVILFPFFPLLALILQGLTETSLFLGLCLLLGEMAYLGALIVLWFMLVLALIKLLYIIMVISLARFLTNLYDPECILYLQCLV